ncbi:LOW QUALITY PROTEIN: uncharacterized protein FYN16_007305 [Cariama cristata]
MPVSFNTLSFHVAFLFGNTLMWFLFLKAPCEVKAVITRTYFIGFLSTMCLHSLMGICLCWDWFKVMGLNGFIGAGFLYLSAALQ